MSIPTIPRSFIQWHQDRYWRFLIFNTLFILALFSPLRDLFATTWNGEYFTYIPFIPAVTIYLLFIDRQRIFTHNLISPIPGLAVLAIGIILITISINRQSALDHNEYLTLITLSMIILWVGGFIICYGIQSAREAILPLLFLIFAIPMPDVLLNKIIVILQVGSTEITYWLLKASGMPIARDGFVFHLPIMDIEVAPQCSGIRSSLSLVITGALAAVLFLKTGWTRGLLMLSIVPIAMLKNGIRISTLSVLGVYVDQRIIESDLHRKGGFVFFIIALLIVWGEIVLLRKMEMSKKVHH